MRLWRISNYADLQGIGGVKTAARWHNRGAPIVYLAEHPALALLEIMVRLSLDPDEIPDDYQLLEIEYNERKGISRLKESILATDWINDTDTTRNIGDEWLQTASSVLLKVPSAILPHSYNYLFNPKHPLAKQAEIMSVRRHPFDPRLK